MKFLSTFLMGASLVCAEENMRELEVLKQLETCFDVMSPAYEKSDRAFAWFSDIPHFLFNAVTHLSTDHTELAVDELIAASPGEGLSFWVHPYSKSEGLAEVLKKKGFALAIVCPLMSWQAELVEVSGFDVRSADRDWEDFMEISSIGFELQGIVKEKYSNILQKIPSENYIIYCEGKPAGVGILLPTGANGGIFNIAVHPEFRNKGLARGMMKFLMNRSYELGLKELVLYSAPETEKFYQSLGFEKMFDIEIFAR